jgi:hypothetical protein
MFGKPEDKTDKELVEYIESRNAFDASEYSNLFNEMIKRLKKKNAAQEDLFKTN